jgi:hypothetical protein
VYTLAPQELKELLESDSSRVTIDLGARGIFSMNEEDIRIRDVGLYEIAILLRGTPAPDTYCDVTFIHTGISDLKKDGIPYIFRHYEENKKSLPFWKSVVALGTSEERWKITDDSESRSERSLLAAVLGEDVSNLDRFVLPGAAAPITLKLNGHIGSAKDFAMQPSSLSIYVEYEYREVTDSPQISLEVLSKGDERAELGIPVQIAPRDTRGLSSGLGTFTRSYTKGTPVIFSVPERYGEWKFLHWEMPQGNTRKEASVRVASLEDNKRYWAVYSYSPQEDGSETEKPLTSPEPDTWPSPPKILRSPDIPAIRVITD